MLASLCACRACTRNDSKIPTNVDLAFCPLFPFFFSCESRLKMSRCKRGTNGLADIGGSAWRRRYSMSMKSDSDLFQKNALRDPARAYIFALLVLVRLLRCATWPVKKAQKRRAKQWICRPEGVEGKRASQTEKKKRPRRRGRLAESVERRGAVNARWHAALRKKK